MPIYSTRAALNTSRAVLHMAVQFSDIALQTASLMHIYTIFTTSLTHFFTWDFFALVFLVSPLCILFVKLRSQRHILYQYYY